MTLTLKSVPLTGISEKPVFLSITISQGADGRMSADVVYRIDAADSTGDVVSSRNISSGLSHEQIVTNPDFLMTYPVLRNFSRKALENVEPDFVSST